MTRCREKMVHFKFKIVFVRYLGSMVLRAFLAESIIHTVLGLYIQKW